MSVWHFYLNRFLRHLGDTIGINSGDFNNWQGRLYPPKCCCIFNIERTYAQARPASWVSVHLSTLAPTTWQGGGFVFLRPPSEGLTPPVLGQSRTPAGVGTEGRLPSLSSPLKWENCNHELFQSVSIFAFLIPINAINYKHLFYETWKDRYLSQIILVMPSSHTRTQNYGTYETETWHSVSCDVLNREEKNCTAVSKAG